LRRLSLAYPAPASENSIRRAIEHFLTAHGQRNQAQFTVNFDLKMQADNGTTTFGSSQEGNATGVPAFPAMLSPVSLNA
jgi:hypothetical protein